MSIWTEIAHRVRAFIFRSGEDLELDDELRFHLDMAVEGNLRQGMNPEEARRQAVLELGGLTQTREAARDARGLRWLERLGQDVRYGLRGIRKNPLFATALVFTLGLGIGANAAMFSVIDALLLRPLPYPESDRLVEVWPSDPERGRPQQYVDLDFGREWADRDDVFAAAFHHRRGSVLYTGGAEPRTVVAEAVSAGFGQTLGIAPLLGRGFTEDDTRPAAEPVVLLSHGFWLASFGADPDVLGRMIELDGFGHRIIGVMPTGFKFPTYGSTELWTALREDGTAFGRPATRALRLVARLPGAVAIEAAQTRTDVLAASMVDAQPRDGGWSIRLMPFDAYRGGDSIRRALWFLVGAVGLILLVATVNCVNLLLARGWSRAGELAVRVALGAPRRRLVGQLLTESLILALAAGIVAVVLALACLRLIEGITPSDVTFYAPHTIAIEERSILFTFGVAAAAGLAVGLVPALLATRVGAATAEARLNPRSARAPVRIWLRSTLVVSEVALSVALLVGAGLLTNSFVRLMRVDPGFRLENVAILTLDGSSDAYPTGETRMAFLRGLETRLEAIPGVVGATTGGGALPAGSIRFTNELETEDETVRSSAQSRLVSHTTVSPDFFELLDVPVVAGRPFIDQEVHTDNAIVDVNLARLLWGKASPVGRRFRATSDSEWMTVVGVIGEIRLLGPHDRFGPEDLEANLAFLTPASNDASSYASIAVRTTGDPRAIFPVIRTSVHEIDPCQPIGGLDTAAKLYMESVQMPRFLLVLMSVLSSLALLLAAVGIYGVLAYGVAQRRFDLGVRIALGARPAALSRAVLGEGLALAAVGATIGTAGALALSGFIRSLLFGVEPGDPLTIAAVVGVSMAAAAAASWWPARRALGIDPVEVLKSN